MTPQNQKVSPVNFSALELMFSSKDLFKGRQRSLYIVVCCVIVGALLMFLKSFYIGLFLMIGALGYVGKLQNERSKSLWRKFASDNGWMVKPPHALLIAIPPTLENVGRSRSQSEIIEGTYKDIAFQLYTYKFTVGSGKNSHTYTYTVFRVVLQAQLPAFMLDSKKEHATYNWPPNYDKISLEGDFDNYFQLLVPKGTAVDVLSVISPDVMHTLQSYNTKQDIQSVGSNLWFIQAGDKRSIQSLPQLFDAVVYVMPEFYHRLKTYRPTNSLAHK